MTESIVLSLIQNTAILLSFSMLYDYLWASDEHSKKWYENVIAGLAVGGIGIVLMMSPWRHSSGLIFDTRTILLCISGLFLGTIPTLIGVVIACIYRIIVSGGGMWMGTATIITSGVIGLLWGKLRPAWRNGNFKLELLGMGVVVHLVMLGCIPLLPREQMGDVLRIIILPILLIYTPGTMLLGILMLNRSASWKNKIDLLNTQALYASLVEQMPAGVFRKTAEGRYEFVNERFCELKGLTEEEILGKTPTELVAYVATKEAAGAFKKRPRQIIVDSIGEQHHQWIMNNGQPIVIEEEYLQPDGSIEYSQVVKTPIFNAPHQVIGSQGMIFDITLQKQLQSELIVAKEKAEDSDRLKTAFLHNISHEIRTPMNAIVGFSSFLNDNDLTTEKSRYYSSVIVQSSNQLLSIIDDIVRIATIEAGQVKINEADFQINSSFLLLYNQFVDKTAKAGIDLQIKTGLPDADAWIVTDETKILEIISNLLVNALKFTTSGHICMGYVLKGKELEFFVEDTGIGIAKEIQEDIFKRFRQADSTLNRQFGGSGLGLSICRAYTDLLGGRIWVESQLGKGSTFYFTLPYKKSNMFMNGDNFSMTEANVQEDHKKQYSILVAEDEDLNFILLREILSPLKMLVHRAVNGAEAVEMIKTGKDIDLVLMDLKMPVMDGYEATKLIKEVCPSLPVLALTAYSHDSDKERAYDCGCSDFISKPFSKKDLIDKLREHLLDA